jgi:MFS-type transporter involved in bile tolerance (Atg22 family)
VEANGLALDMYARATVAMCSLFLGPALLDLANDAAGCTEENPEYSSSSSSMCDNTIYGFRPSSLLTNLATISGLLSSFALPLFGSIVDHTPYRRHVGAYTAAGLVLVKTIEGVILGPSTWFVVTGLQIASALLYQLHITASYAYLSELSTDSHVQAEYNTTFSIILYISTLLFMIQVMGISMGWNVQEDDVSVARIALLISAGTCTLLLAPAWTCFFRDRPAKKCTNSTSSSSVSLCTAGFHQVLITSQQIRNQYPAIRSLLGAIACSEAASGALISVSTTYMKHNLGMNANEIGAVFFVVLLW